MKRIPIFVTRLLIANLIICSAGQASGNLDFQMALESGRLHSATFVSDLVTRMISRINYKNTIDNNYISIKTRFAPEVLDFQNRTTSLKFSGDFAFGQKLKYFGWQFHILDKNYFYRSELFEDISFNIIISGGRITNRLSSNLILRWGGDYIYRDTSGKPQNQLDSYLADIALELQLDRNTYVGMDIIAEKFHITGEPLSTEKRIHQGWRMGPELHSQHKSSFFFNFTYQLMFHYSNYTERLNLEHRLQMVWGRFILKNWSTFVYLNFIFRETSGNEVPAELAYSPINNENWYYLKIGYDISSSVEIYNKIGYTKDELIYRDQAISGWQILAGLEWGF